MIMSITMITPSEVLTEADELCAALGWGSGNFLVPLADAENGPATHFGMRASVPEERVAPLVEAIEQSATLAARVISDVRPDAERLGHFEAVLGELGLVRVDVTGSA